MHLASNIDPMRHLGSVKDDQCGNNRNVSKWIIPTCVTRLENSSWLMLILLSGGNVILMLMLMLMLMLTSGGNMQWIAQAANQPVPPTFCTVRNMI